MGLFIPVRPRGSEAFLSFYATYLLVVYGILARIGVHKADVHDLAQHVFLKVYRNFEKVPAEGVESWLETICRQQASEHYRLYRHRFETPGPDVGVDVPSGDDPYERLQRHEFDQIVKRVLQSMDAKLADVLVRAEFNGESLPKIAAALGVSRNTAQARLVEAKDVFRRRVKKLYGPDFTPFMLLPFGLDTLFRNDHLTPDFIEQARQEVWRGLAHELGLPPAPPPDASPPSEPPASGERLVQATASRGSGRAARAVAKTALERIVQNPLFLLAVGALGGGAAVALWPHGEPPTARHAAPRVLAVVVEDSGMDGSAPHGSPPPAPGPSPTVVVVTAPRRAAPPAPINDRETTNLDQAREMLTRGQFVEALTALRQHERDYPSSQHAAARSRYITLAREGMQRSASKQNGPP